MPATPDARRPTIGAIQAAVCNRFGITLREMVSPRRAASVVQARHAAVWLARRAGYSFPAIGRAFGDRDHTTIMHAVGRVDRLLAADHAFADALADAAMGAALGPPCHGAMTGEDRIVERL